jgi:hypothetical protein
MFSQEKSIQKDMHSSRHWILIEIWSPWGTHSNGSGVCIGSECPMKIMVLEFASDQGVWWKICTWQGTQEHMKKLMAKCSETVSCKLLQCQSAIPTTCKITDLYPDYTVQIQQKHQQQGSNFENLWQHVRLNMPSVSELWTERTLNEFVNMLALLTPSLSLQKSMGLGGSPWSGAPVPHERASQAPPVSVRKMVIGSLLLNESEYLQHLLLL